MKKNEIEVTIKGLPKVGKTTLAVFLARSLNSAGILTKIKDDSSTKNRLSALQNYEMLKGVKIRIVTQLAYADRKVKLLKAKKKKK